MGKTVLLNVIIVQRDADQTHSGLPTRLNVKHVLLDADQPRKAGLANARDVKQGDFPHPLLQLHHSAKTAQQGFFKSSKTSRLATCACQASGRTIPWQSNANTVRRASTPLMQRKQNAMHALQDTTKLVKVKQFA